MRLYVFLLLGLAAAVAETKESFKILVYNSKFGHSHGTFMGNIADILVAEGHNVTSLIPEIYPQFPDGTTKSHIIHVPGDPWTVNYWLSIVMGDFSFVYEDGGWDTTKMIGQTPLLRNSFSHQCNYTLVEYAGIIEQLKKEHFDLVIAENFDFCGIGISHLVQPKALVAVSTTNMFDYQAYQIGQPLLPAIIPASFGKTIRDGSLTDRLYNLIALGTSMWMWKQMEVDTEHVFKRIYGPQFPDLGEITANSAFVLTNSDPFMDFPRPTLRKVVEIGGIGVRGAKALSEEWDKLLSLRRRTVVVSFGTVARAFLMPDSIKTALITAFSRFTDTTFVWKYEKPQEKFAERAPNVLLTEWMPQNDLLSDSRVRGFVSHGGKGSVIEAATRGVPAVFIPLFGDQLRNAAAAAHVGFGHLLTKTDLHSADSIEAALHHILDDEGLRARSAATKKMIESRPFTPQELLIRHVEFAAKMGAIPALHAEGRHLSYFVYYNIDILLGVMVLVLAVVSFTVYFALRTIRRFVKTTPIKNKKGKKRD